MVTLLAACGHERATAPTASDDGGAATDAGTGAASMLGSLVMLDVPTYDESGQSVHPDIVAFDTAWHGSPYWLVMTPYPFGNPGFENPSVLVSPDGSQLAVPAATHNPVVPGLGLPAYNSDPDLLYDARFDDLVMSYRSVEDGYNVIHAMSTHDGAAWSDPVELFRVPNHQAVSQTITPPEDGHPPMMWYVDAGESGCRARSSRVIRRQGTTSVAELARTPWGEAVPTDLSQKGYVIWHMKVRYIPSLHEYWTLYAAFPNDGLGCSDDDLFFARSSNGTHWHTYSRPLLRHERRGWTAAALYRSSFLYDPAGDELRVWLSAADDSGAWHMGFARFHMASLLRQLAAPASARVPGDRADTPPARTSTRRWRTAP
ncbi:MAG TPA: hypothetical protein VG818_03945 [Gemmatimonadaceae bacterium]|nr:hypothetical protein [Gemmatimonadaceae bacterium]